MFTYFTNLNPVKSLSSFKITIIYKISSFAEKNFFYPPDPHNLPKNTVRGRNGDCTIPLPAIVRSNVIEKVKHGTMETSRFIYTVYSHKHWRMQLYNSLTYRATKKLNSVVFSRNFYLHKSNWIGLHGN